MVTARTIKLTAHHHVHTHTCREKKNNISENLEKYLLDGWDGMHFGVNMVATMVAMADLLRGVAGKTYQLAMVQILE